MNITRVYKRGQSVLITIPRHLAKEYELHPGDNVLQLGTSNGILIKKVEVINGEVRVTPIRRDPSP